MLSSVVILIIVFLFLLFFMFYKRDMLIKMFSIDVTSSANRFQEQLEQTADIVIKRLEEQIIHLEDLLEEANEKIANLDNKIQIANKIFEEEDKREKERIEKEKNSLRLDVNSVVPDIIIKEDEIVNSDAIIDKLIETQNNSNLSIDNYKYKAGSDKRTSVVEMADLGYDVNEIAKITGISKGEIMLLLQLNKK